MKDVPFYKLRLHERDDFTRFWVDPLFWMIILLKLSATLFAYMIYAKFSPFTDAALYLSPPENYYTPFVRTRHMILIYSTLKSVVRFDLILYLATSFGVGYVLWRVVRPFYEWMSKPLFFSALLLPHFLIWSGVIGKEAFVVVGYLLLVSVCIDRLGRRRISFLALGFGLYFASFHPHYLLAYGYLGMMTWLLTGPFANRNVTAHSFPTSRGLSAGSISLCASVDPADKPRDVEGVNRVEQLHLSYSSMWLVLLLSLCFLVMGLFVFCLWDFLSPYLLDLMLKIKAMFLGQVGQVRTNRYDIIWSAPLDFVRNLWWGVPISLIGPTLKEATLRPVLLPVFLEGCFAWWLFGYLFYRMVREALIMRPFHHLAAIILLGFVPAVMIGLLVNYPVGIFNPGSAIRYKQSLAPLLYFYPILVMAVLKRGDCESH